MRYKNPALAEIYVKAAFASGLIPDSQLFDFAQPLTVLGLSDREIVGSANVQPGSQLGISPRLRFWDPARKRLVQLARDSLGINNVAPYIGWDEFSSFVNSVITTLEKNDLPSAFRSVDLTTIDRFRVGSEGYRLGDWLNSDGKYIPMFYADSRVPCDIHLGLGTVPNDGFNRQLQIQVRRVQDNMEFQLRCTFDSALEDPSKLNAVLESAHGEAVETFEAIITDRVRNNIMGGVEG